MFTDRIDAKWIDAFAAQFDACKVGPGDQAVILSQTQSRALNVHLAELALARTGASFYHLQLPTPVHSAAAILRSTGASTALNNHSGAIDALTRSTFIADLTVEGLMHAPQLSQLLKGGTRILTISNEHPEALERFSPDRELKDKVRAAVRQCKQSRQMHVTSDAGTDLRVDMIGAATVGIWGWTDKPGTLTHWPGGIVVSFPKAGAVNGQLVFKPGDINLTFKRYFDNRVTCLVQDDFITSIEGDNLDAQLMRRYLNAFEQREAFATSHVGWGLNKGARYEALTMYDQRDTNGTELRALAGNFLYSTGANEFAKRFTQGHFDLPMMDCTITLDDLCVVSKGELTE